VVLGQLGRRPRVRCDDDDERGHPDVDDDEQGHHDTGVHVDDDHDDRGDL
jgi:hypothetical protein